MNPLFSIRKRHVALIQAVLSPFQRVQSKRFAHKERGSVFQIQPHDGFERLDPCFAQTISSGVSENAIYSAGKTISFSTDAEIAELLIIYAKRELFSNMDSQSSSGVDIYGEDEHGELVWICCISPSSPSRMWAKGTVSLKGSFSRFVMFLPSYAAISEVFIKIPDGKGFASNTDSSQCRILFYGSSITQGCAASRPGLNYANQVGIALNQPIMNFGFSSSAKGEPKIIEHIASMHADIYVIEYDHNATVEELEKTHRELYSIIRKENPESYIVFLSRISSGISIPHSEYLEREKIILSTIEYGKQQGDQNLCYISGNEIVPAEKKKLFVDDKHPNDAGMSIIAKHVLSALKGRLTA